MRVAVAIAALVLLSSMASWTRAVSNGDAGALSWLHHPEETAGTQVVVPLADVIEVQTDRYVIAKGMVRIEVIGDPTGIRRGQTWTVAGRWEPSGSRLHEVWREGHPLRRWKKGLGLLGLLGTALLVPVALRRGTGGLEVRDA